MSGLCVCVALAVVWLCPPLFPLISSKPSNPSNNPLNCVLLLSGASSFLMQPHVCFGPTLPLHFIIPLLAVSWTIWGKHLIAIFLIITAI